jgi:hypothetical protein
MIFKYFLAGILECTKNMQGHLQYFQAPEFSKFLRQVLETKYSFMNEKFSD